MDSKKPEQQKKQAKSPAEDRVDSLVSGAKPEAKPEPGQASQRLQEQKKDAASGKPALTEKQRIEARRQRQARKRRPVNGNVISRGVRATAFEARRTAIFIGRSIMAGLDSLKPVFGWIGTGAKALARFIVGLLVLLVGFTGQAFSALGRLVLTLDRVVTARRAFTVIALVAAGLLIVSQFMDVRAVEIGQPGYVQVQDITRAPRAEIKSPVDTHSFFLVVVGVLALAATGATLLGRRRIPGLILTAAGAVVLITAIAIDLPAGLDVAEAELSYSGVSAILLAGFWLEVAAGVVLLISGLAFTFARQKKPAAAREPRPARTRVAEINA